jgi:hypothetical protein
LLELLLPPFLFHFFEPLHDLSDCNPNHADPCHQQAERARGVGWGGGGQPSPCGATAEEHASTYP